MLLWRITMRCAQKQMSVASSFQALQHSLPVLVSQPCSQFQQNRPYAAAPVGKAGGGKGIMQLPSDQQEDYVESDAAKLCSHVCVNYMDDVEGHGPEIKPDSEYPEWLFKLDLEPDKCLEDLDPEKDGWKYWEKWEQRRQDQIHMHNKLKYRYFWMQNSPSAEMVLRYNKYKYKTHKFNVIPNTTPVYMKHTRSERLHQRRWTSLEESESLMENNS